MDPRDRTQASRLVGKHLYLLGHITSPTPEILREYLTSNRNALCLWQSPPQTLRIHYIFKEYSSISGPLWNFPSCSLRSKTITWRTEHCPHKIKPHEQCMSQNSEPSPFYVLEYLHRGEFCLSPIALMVSFMHRVTEGKMSQWNDCIIRFISGCTCGKLS